MSSDGFAGADPARVAAGIVTGIGFLGAGAIIRHGLSIHGLTTAAGFWVTAAIGISVGVGLFSIAILTTALVLALLHFGPRLPTIPGSNE